MSSAIYRHRQHTKKTILNVLACSVAIAVFVAVLASPSASFIPLGIGVFVALRCAVWATMEVELSDQHLRVAFRPIGPKRVISLEGITSVERARNPWWYALGGPGVIYGLLASRRGWTYEVRGLDAIEVQYHDDRGREQMIRIGTDDVDGLEAALASINIRPPPPPTSSARIKGQ